MIEQIQPLSEHVEKLEKEIETSKSQNL